MRDDDLHYNSGPFFLFIGASDSESVVSKLKTTGQLYRKKLLESGLDNWDRIIEIIRDPNLRGVVATLKMHTYDLMASPNYQKKTEELLATLGTVPHVVLVHEAVFFTQPGQSSENDPTEEPGEDDEVSEGVLFYGMTPSEFFGEVDPNIRSQVNTAMQNHEINVLPYRTNAERSVMASAFVDDYERHLLFRVYIPSGRLYGSEADKLVGLFQDWLNESGRDGIRREGYRTANGQVVEFFGSQGRSRRELTALFANFSSFLERCTTNPSSAAQDLVSFGVDPSRSQAMVAKYEREFRRLQMDMRHAREDRILQLAHRLESELVDGELVEVNTIHAMLDTTIPRTDAFTGLSGVWTQPASGPLAGAASVTINQQFINKVEGLVASHISGAVQLGPEPQALLELIRSQGGVNSTLLESAVFELEDNTARQSDRLQAKQRLRAFLSRAGGHLEATAFSLLDSYLKSKTGIG